MGTLENAQRRAEYWKAEHSAANDEIERLRDQRDALLAAMKRAIEFVPAGYGIERECWTAIARAEDQVPDEPVGKTPMARLYGCCADDVPNDLA